MLLLLHHTEFFPSSRWMFKPGSFCSSLKMGKGTGMNFCLAVAGGGRYCRLEVASTSIGKIFHFYCANEIVSPIRTHRKLGTPDRLRISSIDTIQPCVPYEANLMKMNAGCDRRGHARRS